MKKGFITFTTITVATIGLAACGNPPQEPLPFTSLTVSNKTELQAEWHANDGVTREMTLAVNPTGAINIIQEIQKGNLEVTSSQPTIVNASGLNLTALTPGTSTVSVKYKNTLCDSFDITVLDEKTCIELYGTVHAGTQADPLSAADACTVAKHPSVGTTPTPKAWVIKDTVYKIKTPFNPQYLNISVNIGDATNDFLVYRATVAAEDSLEINDKITLKSAIYHYNGDTPETSGSIEILNIEKGPKAEDPDPINDVGCTHAGTQADPFDAADAIKFAEAVNTSISKYYIKGELVESEIDVSYGNATAKLDGPDNTKFIFYRIKDVGGEAFTDANKFKVGDTIVVKGIVTKYVHTDKTVDYETAEGTGELVEVLPAPSVLPTSISVGGLPDEIEAGYYYPTTLNFLPENCNEKEVTWTSDKEANAVIDSKGGVFGVAAGEGVTVTATSVKAPTVAGSKTINVVPSTECPQQTIAVGEFKSGFVQSTNHKNLYIKSTLNSTGFLESTNKGGTEAAIITLANSGSDWTIKVGSKYLATGTKTGKLELVDSSTDAAKFQVVAGLNIFKISISGTDYTIANYGTYETMGLTKLSYVVAEGKIIPSQNPLRFYDKTAPSDPAVPEPDLVTDKTLAEILAVDAADEMKRLYEVSVKVSDLGSKRSGADKYGNLFVTDLNGENEAQVYGSTATASAIAWDNESQYKFTNPNDFLTNSTTNVIGVNDVLKIHCLKTNFKGAAQLNAVIVEVTPGVRPELTDLTITGDNEVEAGKTVTLTAAPVPYSASLGEVTWSVKTGADYVSLPDTKTGSSIVVTGVAAGEAVVTATSGNISKDFALTVKPAEVPENTTYNFVGALPSGSSSAASLDSADAIKAVFKTTSGNLKFTVKAGFEKVYAGANGGSSDTAYTNHDVLKIGASSAGGSLTLVFDESVKIDSVVVNCCKWYNKESKLSVNGSAVQTPTVEMGKGVTTGSELTFSNLNGTHELSFVATTAAISFFSITINLVVAE